MTKRSKVIVILGPTATGKSALAVKIARKLNGEIISADSRQVYKGLDIGTGKIKKREMKNVPHYLLDVVSPGVKFSVAEYKKLTETKIKEIINRNKIPIIVGGTGFYIDTVVEGLVFPQVPPNASLRKKLAQRSSLELHKILKKLDRNRAASIDPNNPARLIRAIEIASSIGRVPEITKVPSKYTFIKIGLSMPKDDYVKKVTNRVNSMFREGLLKEIKTLKSSGITEGRLKEFGFEYNNPTRESVLRGTLKYAKRQKTWWKRDKKIRWFSISKESDQEKVISFLEKEV